MSCSRGSTTRTRPQKHQNRSAFKNDLHDTSKKTKFLNSLEVTGVCERCKEIIDWKIKFKKYKPLVAPRKCVGCEQKTVKYAYHVLCTNCTKVKNVCAKCCKVIDNIETEDKQNGDEEKIKLMLKTLPERKRRTLLRCLKKNDNITIENVKIEDMLSKMGDIELNDEDSNCSSYEESLSGDVE